MKFISSGLALSLVLCCAALACATALERSLKQACPSSFEPPSEAIADAARSIASALSRAVAGALGTADVTSSYQAFAQTVTTAYARIIFSHIWRTTAAGSSACAAGPDHVTITGARIASATSQAFNRSSNAVAQVAASCFSSAVNSAATTATQRASCQICTSISQPAVQRQLETIGFTRTVATVFANVFVAIRDNNAQAAATCAAAGGSG